MSIVVTDLEVTANKHPEAHATNLEWKVLVKVRFASDDPKNWGEFRAFGGAWRRSMLRPKNAPKIRDETHSQLVVPRPVSDVDIEDCDIQVTQLALPLWGHTEKPQGLEDAPLRLGNDQHMEIFYRKPVPGLARSSRRNYGPNRWAGHDGIEERDPMFDENPSDIETLRDTLDGLTPPRRIPGRPQVQQTVAPLDIDFDGGWHIIARDEPGWDGVSAGSYVEYWHQAEFQIRKPNSMEVIRKTRLFLRVRGKSPDREYLQWFD